MRNALAPVAVAASLALVAPPRLAAAPLARDVHPSATGPQRLDLDARAVAHAPSADLRELRLFDESGTEVPFLAVASTPQPDALVEAAWISPIPPTKKTSGFEADFGKVDSADAVEIDGLPTPLMKRIVLDFSADRVHWTRLADEQTLFDLPDEGLRRTTVNLEPTPLRYVRVTWNDASSTPPPLPARVVLRRVTTARRPVFLRVPVEVTPRPAEPRTTRLVLGMPGAGILVHSVVVETPKARVGRPARVLSEPRLTADRLEPALLGAATLRRASRDGLVAEELAIPIGARAPTDRLQLVIDDGDEAPLPVDRVVAVLGPLPWIWFESADGRPLRADFDESRKPPRYDLEADRERLAASDPPRATWGDPRGPVEAAPAAVTREPLPAGGPFDATGYAYRRRIPMTSGLASLLLDEEILARSPTLADVRLVTPEGSQVPYVLESRDEPLRVPLPPLAREPADPAAPGTTRYVMSLPPAGVPPSRLAVTTAARVFEREVRVIEQRPGADRRAPPERVILARARWAAATDDEPAPALVLDLPRSSATSLTLEIDEGDNAPLPLDRPELLLPQRRLRFVHPGHAMEAWFGSATARPPRYDVALLAPRLLAERAQDIELAPGPAEWVGRGGGPGAATLLLWIVLGVTLLALAVVLARVTKQGPATGA